MEYIVTHSELVPQTQHILLKAFSLDNEKLVFLPICARCGQPILEFDRANAVVLSESGFALPDPSQRAIVEGHELDPIQGEVVALHYRCDTRHEKPWVPADFVLRTHSVKSRRRRAHSKGGTRR